MKSRYKNINGSISEALVWLIIAIAIVAVIPSSCYYFPKYRVYKNELRGKASLKEAECSKQIAVEQARAEEQSALLLAEARITRAQATNKALRIEAEGEAAREVIRAEGAAKSNSILGESLKNNEEYLRYLWITGLHDGSGERIYIPTEAGMPILEAGELSNKNSPKKQE